MVISHVLLSFDTKLTKKNKEKLPCNGYGKILAVKQDP
jgi:hypothetical protein